MWDQPAWTVDVVVIDPDRRARLVGKVLGALVGLLEAADGLWGEQELAGARPFFDLRNGDPRVGDGPAGKRLFPIRDVLVAGNLFFRGKLDPIQDLF